MYIVHSGNGFIASGYRELFLAPEGSSALTITHSTVAWFFHYIKRLEYRLKCLWKRLRKRKYSIINNLNSVSFISSTSPQTSDSIVFCRILFSTKKFVVTKWLQPFLHKSVLVIPAAYWDHKDNQMQSTQYTFWLRKSRMRKEKVIRPIEVKNGSIIKAILL